MIANTKNIYIEGFRTGASTDVIFEWILYLEEEDGSPMVNIDAATSSFRIKKVYPTEEVLLEATTGDGITVDADEGSCRLRITIDHMENFTYNLEEQEFIYDWELTDDTGRKYRLYKGTATLGGDV